MERRVSVAALAVIVFAVLSLSSCLSVGEAKDSIAPRDISKIPDGSYVGTCCIFPVNVKVRTTILSGRIENIELLRHFNGQGKSAEKIIPIVIEGQSLEVDVIAGATQSSVTILKAIDASLENGLEKAGRR